MNNPYRRFKIRALAPLFFLILIIVSAGQAQTEQSTPEGSINHMEYGSVLAQSFRCPQINRRVKQGLAVRFSDPDLLVMFDTDRLMYATAVAGGSIDLRKTDYRRIKGQRVPEINGSPIFHTGSGAGVTGNGSLGDPRPNGLGLLPADQGRFQGFYRHGDRVLLSYSAGDADILEYPHAVRSNETIGFVRTIRVRGNSQQKTFLIANEPVVRKRKIRKQTVRLHVRQGILISTLVNAPNGAHLSVSDTNRIRAHVPASEEAFTFHIVIAKQRNNQQNPLPSLRNQAPPDLNWTRQTKGGPSQWSKTLTRSGTRSSSKDAYVIDRIPVPRNNPWNSFMRLTGIDFFDSGRAAVSTMNGDVWLVDGLNDSLSNVSWKRFAAGLYQPLGLEIKNGDIFVLEQGQITRLHDLNNDQEADYYERYNGQGPFKPRAYWMELETDSNGRFYYVRDGHRAQNMPEHGRLMQVSADGTSATTYAYGLRQANGLGINPKDVIQVADQQGNWVPATRIDRIKKNRFYGYRPHAPEEIKSFPFTRPITWIPQNVDNSAGDQVYVPSDRWGPLSNHWLHMSWGRAQLFLVLQESVDGVRQGGIVPLPVDTFKAGLHRGAFAPHDNQLYMLGIGVPGWASVSTNTTSFNRMRYTGDPLHLPVSLRVKKKGIQISFSRPLSGRSARNTENYTVKRWTYRYSARYGSAEFSLRHKGKEQRDPVNVSDVRLKKDGRTVFLKIPDLKPARQMMIRYHLQTPEGKTVKNVIYHTIHKRGK